MKIKPADDKILADLVIVQNFHAFSLGVARAEYLQQRSKVGEPASRLDYERLGVLEWEYAKHEKFWSSKIRQTELEQRKAHGVALRNLGIDIDSGHFEIANGIAMKLINGAYVPVGGST